jgi:hypothetical protein
VTDQVTASLSAMQEHAAAAVEDVRKAYDELRGLLVAEQHSVADEVLQPARRLVQGIAGFAEIAVDPLAEFVQRQRELADQMAAWAELQHQLADSMAAWADLQRQLANAFAVWLAPAGGAAKLTTRLLHELSAEEVADKPVTGRRAGRTTTRRG